ncbi:hypothetical protein, partial [Streptomyces sp. CRN 30]|uniref:hypothetical protein n=1 Tax=Streptomyces sp. CRN 30 TaxID=3075613 RepID=UPI002A818A6A
MAPTSARRDADGLLHVLDPLPATRRTPELVARVRSLSDPRPVVDELWRRGAYGRQLAVVAASATGDTAWIADRIADPDPWVRGHALRVADSLGVPDDVFAAALDDAPESVRRDLLRAVVAGGRTALADRLVERVRRATGDAEAARVLPGCSPATVDRLLPELLHATTAWTALAKRHPKALLDAVERDLRAAPAGLRDTWWRRYAYAAATLAPGAPARVLRMLEEHGPSRLPFELRDRVAAFALAAPARVLRLLLTPAWSGVARAHTLSGATLRRLTREDSPELVAYGRALLPYGALPRLLGALPPARRYALYEAAREGRGQGTATVDGSLLAVLPRRAAAGVARDIAARAREGGAADDSGVVLLAESHLPVAEVRDRLLAATRRPGADDRAAAWPLLIGNAARSGDPAAVTAVLAQTERLRNEQDPVRLAALRALADVRPALYTEDAADRLDRIATDAVEARDSSADTRRALTRLALAVLREHAADGGRDLVNWALRTLVRISGSTGGADLGRLDHTLRRGQEHRVYEALRPWIEAGAEKNDYSLAFALTRAVGRRAAGMPALQDLLRQAFRYGDVTTASTALLLWLEPAAPRDERVAHVLAHDPSAAVLPVVGQVLVRRRTDLLDVLLADTPPYGRFLAEGTPFDIPARDGDVRRWVPRQQAALLARVTRRVADPGLPSYERAEAVADAAAVPDGGAEALLGWTDADDVVLAEAALTALARTDRAAETLPLLLSRTDGDRARAAVPAAARVSREVPPSRLAARLRDLLDAPGTKVTARKEAVRLAAARLPAPAAAELLTAVYARPGTHADVRAACVFAAGPLLAHEEVWDMLRDAAGGAPVLRAAVLRLPPLDLPGPYRTRYAGLVRATADTDDPATAVLAYRALADWTPWSAEGPAVLAGAVTDLADRAGWTAAAHGLVAAAVGSPAGLAALR